MNDCDSGDYQRIQAVNESEQAACCCIAPFHEIQLQVNHLKANACSIKPSSLDARAVENCLNAAVTSCLGTKGDKMRHILQFPRAVLFTFPERKLFLTTLLQIFSQFSLYLFVGQFYVIKKSQDIASIECCAVWVCRSICVFVSAYVCV